MKNGDIVIYHLRQDAEGRLEFPNNGQRTAPAIVVNAWDDPGPQHYVNVRVFQDGSESPVWKTSVGIGTEPGQVSAKE